MVLRDGRGRARDHQNGSIYWTPEQGAHEVHGDIRVKWAQLGGANGVLGYPVTDELGCGPGNGRYNHFHYLWAQRAGRAARWATRPRTCMVTEIASPASSNTAPPSNGRPGPVHE
jgi:uncharacterized protein with LGFP repeats